MKDASVLRVEKILRSPLLIIALAVFGGVATVAVVWLLLLIPGAKDVLASQFWFSIIVMAAVVGLMLGATAFCIFAERKVAAYIQDRDGPNRNGWLGLLQSAADGLKLLLKEDVIPGNVDRSLHVLAPGMAFAIAFVGFAIIPWTGDIHFPWMAAGATVVAQVANVDIGFLYLIAVASMGVYGVVLAGFASNNKYAFYGGMRAAAQMISYEIPLGLSLLVILLTTGSLRLGDVVDMQASSGLWFVIYQPLAFILLLISGFAETNRAPFDLAECEQELVAGFHTEYSALKFGMFFLGEYAHMVTNSALMIALFMGGWHFWFLPGVENHSWWAGLIQFVVYWGKISAFIWFYMVIRWTLPRFRFDQLMRVAWQGMVPIGMGLVLGTAILVAFDLHTQWWACLAMNAVVLVLTLAFAKAMRKPVTGRQANLPDIQVVA